MNQENQYCVSCYSTNVKNFKTDVTYVLQCLLKIHSQPTPIEEL